MITVINEKTHSPVEFQTATRRRIVMNNKGDGATIEPADFPLGILRMFLNDSGFKVTADGEEAEARIKEARDRKKAVTFSLVHGSGEKSREDTLASEAGQGVRIRDDFTPAQRAIMEEEARKASELAKVAAGGESNDPPKPPAAEVDPNHPIARLLAKADTLEWGEFRRVAKELLRDSYPGGSVSKDDVVAALNAKLQKGD